jgi:cation diffusion facilitator family transporter
MKKHDKNADFKIAEKWAVIGMVGNILLSILKFAAGILGNSSAMIADAIHSASDIVASFFVYIGIKISKKPADEGHPYGHFKAEVVTTLIVGVMLWMAGVEIIKTAIETIRSGDIQTPGMIALVAAVISIGVKEIMYRFTYKAGKEINSPSTIANAMDHRSDAYSSVATLIGIGAARMGFPIMDPIAGIVVSLFIFRMGYEIVVEAVKQIMDENVGDDMIEEVRTLSANVEGVVDTHDIRIRQSGSVYLIDMDIVVDGNITMKMAHDICDDVRADLQNKMDRIEEVRVHIDPNCPE